MEAASLRLLSKNFPKLFTGCSEMVGIGVPAIEKRNLSATLPFFKTKDLDFAGLNDILAHPISFSSPVKIHKGELKARCLPVEVGCRGFAGQSLIRAYTALGITGERRRRAICNNTEAAEKASRWLWIKRADPWFSVAGAQAEAS